jgi:hypothetical protein
MAVSHSFTGEDIEDGGDEKADAERDHHNIKHREYLPTSLSLPAPSRPVPSWDQLTGANEGLCIKIREALVFTPINKL